MDPESPLIPERGLLTLSDAAWSQAVLRAQVIGPLAALPVVGRAQADEAAVRLGLSRRWVYRLIRRYRQGLGVTTDLAPGRSDGGRGKGRLPEPVEHLVRERLHQRFLSRPKCTLAGLHRDIAQACRSRGLPVPTRNTVALRIAALDPREVARKRDGAQAARPLQAAAGATPETAAPLDRVQIDHTPVDLIVVDERDRQPIGRPYLSVAIDDSSRCLIGMVVTLEAPSAVSVGLCLAHAVCDKRPGLEALGVAVEWPMGGKPKALYLDNGSEFHSEALRRGCEQHGIALTYRPAGRPHFGGIIERVIGTAMQWVHALPGTTFSNPTERGTYDADGTATLTLRELERWLTLAVAAYHGSVHATLLQTPAARWAEGIARAGPPPLVTHATAFLVDFVPVLRRTLTRTGFALDHIRYFADALKPWIARRESLPRFLIRRDPRDISRIWVLEPDGRYYLEVPYRTLSHPAITL
jgi:putative transposase